MLLALRATADAVNEQAASRTPSALHINTSSPVVRLAASTQPSALTIDTALAVDLTAALNPGGSLTIPTGPATLTFNPNAIRIDTGISVSLTSAPTPSRLNIPTGALAVTANGTALRPITTGIQVTLAAGQRGTSLTIPTGPANVSLTASGPAFAFSRDLVIAAQPDLATTALTQPVLLGITFTDNDFRSVANGGRIQQTGAEDVQFALIAGGTVLNHNIVSHNPVNGTIIFDLQLPTWDVAADVRIRMSYGFVGRMTGRIAITTGISVALSVTPSLIDFLPEDPAVVFARDYPANPATTYYVRAGGSGIGTPGDPSSRGSLAETAAGVNDGARIYCADGSYPSMSVSPRQLGRIAIIAENPVHDGVDLSNEDGQMINPYVGNSIGARKDTGGLLTLDNFSKPWIEGWKIGRTGLPYSDPLGATQGKWSISIRAGGRGWYVRNAMFNNHTQQVAYDGPGEIVHFQNYHYSDGKNDTPPQPRPPTGWPDYDQDDATSDYHVFVQQNSNTWIVGNMFRGITNQTIANKQSSGPVYFRGNVIDDRITRNQTIPRVMSFQTGGIIYCGQSPDTVNDAADFTAQYWEIKGNLFCTKGISAGSKIIYWGNCIDVLVEDNTFKRVTGGGDPYLFLADLVVERDTPCLRGSVHPRSFIFRNNTIVGPASDWRYIVGQHFVADPSPNVRYTNITIGDNTVTGGGLIPCQPWAGTGIPDAGGGLQGGFSPQYDRDARIGLTRTANSGFGPKVE